MPARPKRDKRRTTTHINPEAIELFHRGLNNPHDQSIRIALAAALRRSKFAACPLDLEPRSLIGGDREPVEVVLALRAQLIRRSRQGGRSVVVHAGGPKLSRSFH
jgi:hypothetical protein